MGELSISMAMFTSYVSHYQRVTHQNDDLISFDGIPQVEFDWIHWIHWHLNFDPSPQCQTLAVRYTLLPCCWPREPLGQHFHLATAQRDGCVLGHGALVGLCEHCSVCALICINWKWPIVSQEKQCSWRSKSFLIHILADVSNAHFGGLTIICGVWWLNPNSNLNVDASVPLFKD